MANVYGRLTGNRGSATRTGSTDMQATVQTWDGALTLIVRDDGSWDLFRHRPVNDGHHSLRGRPIASGTVETDTVELPDDAYALTSEAAGQDEIR